MLTYGISFEASGGVCPPGRRYLHQRGKWGFPVKIDLPIVAEVVAELRLCPTTRAQELRLYLSGLLLSELSAERELLVTDEEDGR